MPEYQKLTVVKLKELLKDRALPVTGKKADLIERLEENDAQVESADRQASQDEAEPVLDQSSANGEEAPEPPPEKESIEEPVDAQISEPVAARKEELQPPLKNGVDGESTVEGTSQPIAAHDDEVILPSRKVNNNESAVAGAESVDYNGTVKESRAESTSKQEAIEARREVQNDATVTIGDSIKTQPEQDARLSGTNNSQEAELTTNIENGAQNTIQDTQMTSPSDSQAMPAPELPVSQIPRPSIETQQTQEARNNSRSAEPNSAMEGITRTTTTSSVNTQELLEDRMKRKRRSHSPPVSSTEVAIKKAKVEDGSPQPTLMQDDLKVLPSQDSTEAGAGIKHDSGKVQSSPKDGAARQSQTRALSPTTDRAQDTEMQPEYSDQQAGSNRHPPTNCLYINNLMRPLQPSALRTHLEKLAGDDSTETVGIFFLEATRRYGIASFSSAAAASRARSGLHDRVWPDESNRKALSVDFIPEKLGNELIEIEEDNANKPRLERKRFEILYMERDGHIVPEIHNADSSTAIQHRAGQTSLSTTSAPQHRPSVPSILPPPPREETGKNFKALDDLFPSTIAKPRLYYLPLSSEVAEKRLSTLSRATMREESSKLSSSEEKRRYTFEDGDIVDKGPEYGFGRGGGGNNGTRGRAGGFGDRGYYRGRGRGNPRGDYRSGAGIGYHDRW